MAKPNNPWGRKPSGPNPGRTPPGGGGFGGGSGGGNTPKPDLDLLLRRGQARMKGMFGPDQNRNDTRIALMVLAGLAMLWVASGIYRVNSDELGVVLRFGKYSGRITTPGLNYHLPYPIETVMIPSVTSVNKVEVGQRGTVVDNPTLRKARFAESAMDGAPQSREGMMLTRDRNVVDVDFEVQWKIDASAPEKYLFNMRDPEMSIKEVAESAMREVIGQHTLDEVLTTAQSQVAEDTKTIMQEIFNDYGAGIEIIAVNLSRPDVPQPVIDEFQDVKRAEQNKETAESVAEGYRNEILPKAKGEAAQMEQQALAYKARVIADAEGDIARFNNVYAEYVQAKDVTRKRIYLETMEEVMRDMPKVIVDESARGNGGVVQMLPVPAAPAKAAGQ